MSSLCPSLASLPSSVGHLNKSTEQHTQHCKRKAHLLFSQPPAIAPSPYFPLREKKNLKMSPRVPDAHFFFLWHLPSRLSPHSHRIAMISQTDPLLGVNHSFPLTTVRTWLPNPTLTRLSSPHWMLLLGSGVRPCLYLNSKVLTCMAHVAPLQVMYTLIASKSAPPTMKEKFPMELALLRELSKKNWKAIEEAWLTHIATWLDSDLLTTYCPNEDIHNTCQKLKTLIQPLI